MPDLLTDPAGLRELDAAVAREVMGWEVEIEQEECSQFTPGAHWVNGAEFYAVSVPLVYPKGDLDTEGATLPFFSTSLDEVAAVEAEIARRGLIKEYLMALAGMTEIPGRVVDGKTDIFAYTANVWGMVTADAATRCRAALLAVRASAGREEEAP